MPSPTAASYTSLAAADEAGVNADATVPSSRLIDSSGGQSRANVPQPVARDDLESGGSAGAGSTAEEDSALLSYAQDTLQTRLQDRGSDEMLQSGEEIRAGIAAASESAEKVGARLKTVAVAIGLAGAGDLLEQGYIAISYVQSFSLFTVPDFINWPEAWLGCLDWLHPLSFGLDLGVVLPGAGPGLLFAARLAPPVLVLGWGLFQSKSVFTYGDKYRERWLERNIGETWPATRRTMMLCGFAPPAVALALASVVLHLSGTLWAPASTPESGSGSENASGSYGGGDDEQLNFSATATGVGLAAAGWSACGTVVVLYRVFLRRMHAAIKARGEEADPDNAFFSTWAFGEGSGLLFLYMACYIGPVTACLEAIAAHDGDAFVPAVLWGTICACAAVGGVLMITDKLDSGARVFSFAGVSVVLMIGAVVFCAATASDGLFVAAWLLLPFYALVPLALLTFVAYATMDDNDLKGLEDEEEFKRKVAEAKDKRRGDDAEDAFTKASFFALVGRYEAAFWWAKPAMLLEKALVAVVVLSLHGRPRLWLSLGLAGASFAWVAATRPYLGNAEDRTDIFSRFSNLVMVGVGAAIETTWITKKTGQYALAVNSLVAAVVFTIRYILCHSFFISASPDSLVTRASSLILHVRQPWALAPAQHRCERSTNAPPERPLGHSHKRHDPRHGSSGGCSHRSERVAPSLQTPARMAVCVPVQRDCRPCNAS